MTHVRNPLSGHWVYVRVGSLSTKPAYEQWRKMRTVLRRAPHDVHWIGEALKLQHNVVWPHSGEPYIDEFELEGVYTDLEWLAEEVRRVMAWMDVTLPLKRRIELLENVKGRTPEEAEIFKAKAEELRRRLDGERLTES
jgi:hypothetical protein